MSQIVPLFPCARANRACSADRAEILRVQGNATSKFSFFVCVRMYTERFKDRGFYPADKRFEDRVYKAKVHYVVQQYINF